MRKIVSDMAAVMTEKAGDDGACTIEDLRLAGFTDSEITTHGDAARDKAGLQTAARDGFAAIR